MREKENKDANEGVRRQEEESGQYRSDRSSKNKYRVKKVFQYELYVELNTRSLLVLALGIDCLIKICYKVDSYNISVFLKFCNEYRCLLLEKDIFAIGKIGSISNKVSDKKPFFCDYPSTFEPPHFTDIEYTRKRNRTRTHVRGIKLEVWQPHF